MSGPYVYTPQLYPATQPQSNPYLDPYYNQQQPSPYIPDASLYPSSPYNSAPNTPRKVRFETFNDDNMFVNAAPRPRRPSWHGGQVAPVLTPAILIPAAGYTSPFLQAEAPPFLQNRRHSFGNSPYQPWSSLTYPHQPGSPWAYHPNQPPTFQIHPFLNGESPRPDFLFDISSPKFNPVLFTGPGQVAQLPAAVFQESATHPPITRLRIIHETIPQWPIDLEWNPYTQSGGVLLSNAVPTPITMGDILVAIHKALHTRISHIEWAKLSVTEETAVARAYTRRCKSIPSVAQFEASQGVRRVDYLLDQVVFRGLIRIAGQDGQETMRLITGPYPS